MSSNVIDLPRRLDAFLDRVEDTARADNEARRAVARVLDGGLANLPRDVTEEERREVVLAQVHARHEHRIAMHEVAAEVRLLRDLGHDVSEEVGVLELLPLYNEIRTTLNEDPATTEAFRELNRGEGGPVRQSIEAMIVADADLANLPDPVPLVRELLAVDSIGTIIGAPGKGKTFVAMNLAYSVARGVDFHGRLVEQGPVVYVAAEGRAGLKLRRAAYREHYDVDDNPPVTWIAGVVNLLSATTVTALADVVAGLAPKLIILDTVARLSPGGREDVQDLGQFVAAMDELRAETGACVLAVHHMGKDETRGARGSSVFMGAMDTAISVGSTAKGRIECMVTKQKDMPSEGERFDFTLEPAATSVVAVPITGVDYQAEMSGAKAKAYEAFKEIAVTHGVTSTEWLAASDVPRTTFFRARAELLDDGRIEHRDRRYFLADIDPTEGLL